MFAPAKKKPEPVAKVVIDTTEKAPSTEFNWKQ
jgi:hypothetical protein